MGRAVLVALLCVLNACRTSAPPRSEVTIAAAANLASVFQKIGADFESQTAIHPVFSFASTAQLAQQIENAAPYDVFAAADTEHVDELDRRGLLVPGTRAVYATGILALWMRSGTDAAVARIQDLTSPEVRVVAVANPQLA